MFGSNRQLWQPQRERFFLATILLDPLTDDRQGEEHPRLPSVTHALIALMDTFRFPTTWAVSDPAFSAATPRVLRSKVPHELAISGDPSWVGPTAGRTRFARELTRRVAQARQAGLAVTTFVPRVASVERHIDLIVKQQITAVAGPNDSKNHCQAHAPRLMHYGIWEFPVHAQFPSQTAWFTSGGWTIWRCVCRAVRDSATFHLVIDAPTLAKHGKRAEKAISRLMARVASLRDRGQLVAATLRSAATQLAAVPSRSPQRSILRPAA
jgi:hypothetical protein